MPASALATDLYQLTMASAYFATDRHVSTRATFELFVRRLPERRHFLVAAGLSSVLDFLEGWRFADDEVLRLRTHPAFARVPAPFFEYLRTVRFTGDVFAVPEGTPVFANEPLLRVTGPLAETQLVETAALALVNFQTSVASKAARVVLAAEGRPVMEFGARRAHGLEAARLAARAAYLAGCASTSFTEAAVRFGIPLSGTMAHSWVLASPDELTAFQTYQTLFGRDAVFLLDTYDTLAAAESIVRAGLRPAGVRLDSGDLMALSRAVRTMLDAGGLRETRIIASGDLDEYRIHDLVSGSAPIDAFGAGTSIVTSIDAPALGGVYKLVELEEKGEIRRVMKTSPGKATLPGRKQVWRVVRGATAAHDLVTFEEEPPPASAMPLLQPVMRGGRRIAPDPSLVQARDWCRTRIAELPPSLRELDESSSYPVLLSESLSRLATSD